MYCKMLHQNGRVAAASTAQEANTAPVDRIVIDGPAPRVERARSPPFTSVEGDVFRFAPPARRATAAASKPEPYPQVLEGEGPDLLVISYPQVADDSKPELADHQFVSAQATVLQAPAPL